MSKNKKPGKWIFWKSQGKKIWDKSCNPNWQWTRRNKAKSIRKGSGGIYSELAVTKMCLRIPTRKWSDLSCQEVKDGVYKFLEKIRKLEKMEKSQWKTENNETLAVFFFSFFGKNQQHLFSFTFVYPFDFAAQYRLKWPLAWRGCFSVACLETSVISWQFAHHFMEQQNGQCSNQSGEKLATIFLPGKSRKNRIFQPQSSRNSNQISMFQKLIQHKFASHFNFWRTISPPPSKDALRDTKELAKAREDLNCQNCTQEE